MNQQQLSTSSESELAETRSELLHSLMSGDVSTASRLVDTVISAGWAPSHVYVDLVGHCLAEIGAKWHAGELSIAVEHTAVQMALHILGNAQRTYGNDRKVGKRAVVASVEGDKHVIGGLTFADLLRFEGWDVQFLGADVPKSALVELVEKECPDLVALSVTLERYLSNASETVKAIKRLKSPPVVVVGGGLMAENPISEADYSGEDGVKAVSWVVNLFDSNESSESIEVLLSLLGDRIKRLRKDRGLSQQELASQANLDRSYISAVENGKQNVSFATLKVISDGLDVPISELIVRSSSRTHS